MAYESTDSAVGYTLDEFSYCVTGGVGVRCPQCERRYFLPGMTDMPSVSEVIASDEPTSQKCPFNSTASGE